MSNSKHVIELHNYLKANSYYSVTLNPPESEGGKGCDDSLPLCMGGRIGDPRTIGFDLKTQKLMFFSERNLAIIIATVSLAILVSFVLTAVMVFKKFKLPKHEA